MPLWQDSQHIILQDLSTQWLFIRPRGLLKIMIVREKMRDFPLFQTHGFITLMWIPSSEDHSLSSRFGSQSYLAPTKTGFDAKESLGNERLQTRDPGRQEGIRDSECPSHWVDIVSSRRLLYFEALCIRTFHHTSTQGNSSVRGDFVSCSQA
jgi:hypothetical protein